MLKRAGSLVLIAMLAISVLGVASPAQATAITSQAIPGQYIVVLHDSVAEPGAVANEIARAHGLRLGHVYAHALRGFAATIPAARLAAISADPRVAFVSEDREVWATAQTLPTGVDRIEADLSSTKAGDGAGSVNVAVAIIDTGIQSNHPDLNVVGGVNCSTGRSFEDGNGHGTHVAGTVAAIDNNAGVVGVAPGAPLYAVRVLNNAGSGSWSSVICGVDWVTANAASRGIKVANMSLSGGGSDDGNCGNSNNDALHKAICASVARGVTYVVAAGNSNANLANSVPAAYNEVLTVTAMADFNGRPGGGAAATCRSDVDDTAADFSNWTTVGSSDVGHTIAAPGVCINSTWLRGGYNTISGTSMASPHAAGVVALCIASGPCAGLSPAQIISKLRSDAASRPASYGFVDDPNSPNGNRYYGHLVYAGGY
jgi:subtilisin